MTSGILAPHETKTIAHVMDTMPNAGVCDISGGVDLVGRTGTRTWYLVVPSTTHMCPS